MLYEFECIHCHNRTVRPYAMREAPGLGCIIPAPCPACQERNCLMRVVSVPVVNKEALRASNKYPYVSRQFGELKGIHRHTPEGHPVIESRSHEIEVGAMNRLKRV